MADSKIIIGAKYPDFELRGGLDSQSQPLQLSSLVAEFTGDSGAIQAFTEDSDTDDFIVSSLNFSANPTERAFAFQVTLENTPVLSVGGRTFEFTTFDFQIEKIAAEVSLAIAAQLGLGAEDSDNLLLIDLNANYAEQVWRFSAALAEPRTLTDILTVLLAGMVDLGSAGDALDTITIEELMLEFDTSPHRYFAFTGVVSQELNLGNNMALTLSAEVIIETYYDYLPVKNQRQCLRIAGAASFTDASLDFLGNLDVQLIYKSYKTKVLQGNLATNDILILDDPFPDGADSSLEFLLVVGDILELSAIYDIDSSIITIKFPLSNFANLLDFFIQLADPSQAGLTLGDPWDDLLAENIDDPDALGNLLIKIDLNPASRSVSVSIEQDINLGIARIREIGFTYTPPPRPNRTPPPNAGVLQRQRNTNAKKGKFKLILTIDYPGASGEEIAWDPMEDPAPDVPGQQKKTPFELAYLGIGQRITLSGMGPTSNTEQVVTALANAILDLEDTSDTTSNYQLEYNREAGWLIGADFTVIEAIRLAFIFNDPFLYGLMIELGGETLGKLAGLKFDILYRRITENIGVYHTELTLPDAMRQLFFGAVSITLPIIVLNIYTNSDFRVDVGFPARGDFSRSAVVEAGIFTGAGGFYFAKLSGATANMVPVITNGNWETVIAFGLGLKIGIGRSFSKGPLHAELSLTVQGIFEGVFAWFKPTQIGVKKDTYYVLQASLAIVGRLYGAVDFVVIAIDIEVVVYATVQLRYIIYEPMLIRLEAGVRVKASIKIIFVRIHFSFTTTISQSFTIGSSQPTPWVVDPTAPLPVLPEFPVFATGGGGAMPNPVVMEANTETYPRYVTPMDAIILDSALNSADADFTAPFNWTAKTIWSEKPTLHLYFIPAITQGLAIDDPLYVGDNARDTRQAKGVALLSIPQTSIGYQIIEMIDGEDGETERTVTKYVHGFDTLAGSLLLWGLYAYHGQVPSTITQSDLETVYSDLEAIRTGSQDYSLFTFDELISFISANFDINIVTESVLSEDPDAFVFPMLPQLTLSYTGNNATINFSTHGLFSASDLRTLIEKFNTTRASSSGAQMSGSTQQSLAQFLFVDYFAATLRSIIQQAIDLFSDERATYTADDLLTALNSDASFVEVGGIISRSLLGGMRLENTLFDISREEIGLEETYYPLYVLTGQQFVIDIPADTVETDDEGVETSREVNPFNITLSKSDSDTWLDLSSATSLTYELDNRERTLATTLKTQRLAIENLPVGSEAQSMYRAEVALQVALTRATKWTKSDDNLVTRIWALQEALDKQLKTLAQTDDSFLRMSLYDSKNSVDSGISINATNYRLATLIEFEIRRVTTSLDGQTVQDVYLIVGTNDKGEAQLERLFDILHGQNDDISYMDLLYRDEDGDYQSYAETARILRTNLSTMMPGISSNDDALFSADLNDDDNFVKLLWQASTLETGGYYLHLRHFSEENTEALLPDSAFVDGETAKIYLLAWDTTPISQDAVTVNLQAHHNCLFIADTAATKLNVTTDKIADAIDQMLVLELPDVTQIMQKVDAGNLLVRMERGQPDASDDDKFLENLYQLMAYTIDNPATPGVDDWTPTLPVMPLIDSELSDEDAETADWVYERVIPMAKWWQEKQLIGAVDATLNPYTGISLNADGIAALNSIIIDYQLRDIFGNETIVSAENGNSDPLAAETLALSYTDSVIGINQWASLAETYYFLMKGATPLLSLRLQLQIAAYSVTEEISFDAIQEKVSENLVSYRRIAHQLAQADMSATVANTIASVTATYPARDPETSDTIDISDDLHGFVSGVVTYLETLQGLQASQQAVNSDDSLNDLADRYHTTALSIAKNNLDVIHFGSLNLTFSFYTGAATTRASIETALAQSPIVLTSNIQTFASNPDDAIAEGIILDVSLAYNAEDNTLTEIRDGLNEAFTKVNEAGAGFIQPLTTDSLIAMLEDETLSDITSSVVTTHILTGANTDLNTSLNHMANVVDSTSLDITTTTELNTLKKIGKHHFINIASIIEANRDSTELFVDNQTITIPYLQILTADTDIAAAGSMFSVETDNESLDLSEAYLTSVDGLFTETANQQSIIQKYNLFGSQWTVEWLTSKPIATLATQVGTNTGDFIIWLNNHDHAPQIKVGSFIYYDDEQSIGSTISFDSILSTLNSSYNETQPFYLDDLVDLLEDTGLQTGISLTLKPDYLVDWARANQHIAGLLKSGESVTWLGTSFTIDAYHTLSSLANTIAISVPKLASILESRHYTEDGKVVVPPSRFESRFMLQQSLQSTSDIFPVAVTMTLARNENLIHEAFSDVPAVQQAIATFAPEMGTGNKEVGDNSVISIQDFAANFEQIFPGLKLAIGRDEVDSNSDSANSVDPGSELPLWAVQFADLSLNTNSGKSAISVTLKDDIVQYYAIPPLATRLISDTVEHEEGMVRYEDIDLDIWLRDCLNRIDDILDPAKVVTAYAEIRESIDSLLEEKRKLADALAERVMPVFDTPEIPTTSARSEAVELIRQQLLIKLSNAYDIETLVQLKATTEITETLQNNNQYASYPSDGTADPAGTRYAPRIVGQPVVLDDPQDKSKRQYTLSQASLPLVDGEHYLTFLFNTRTPTDDRNVKHQIEFEVADLEYDRKVVDNIQEYIASRWLKFIIPITHSEGIQLEIPVPLRSYPMPPALIKQSAKADPDSQSRLASIREWDYQTMYERPEIAQDNVYIRIMTNTEDRLQRGVSERHATEKELFDKLAEFRLYVQTNSDKLDTLESAELAEFVTKVISIANALPDWTPPQPISPAELIDYIEITERKSGENGFDVRLEHHSPTNQALTFNAETVSGSQWLVTPILSGYNEVASDDPDYPFSFEKDTANFVSGLGISDLPDRIVSVQNLDIINQQNASSDIWLMRNVDLNDDDDTVEESEKRKTNPHFIYHTPVSTYINPVMPFLINNAIWNIADEGHADSDNPPANNKLVTYVKWLTNTILPQNPDKAYAVQIGCQYAFRIFFDNASEGSDQELITRIPILLGLHQEMESGSSPDALDSYVNDIVSEVLSWHRRIIEEDAPEAGARFIFQFRLYSRLDETNPTTPMLQIDNLRLFTEDIDFP